MRSTRDPGRRPVPARVAVADDRGLVVLGWLTKVVLTLAVVGIACFDLVAIGATKVRLGDDANAAARAANTAWNDTRGNAQAAFNAAAASADEQGAYLDPASFRIDRTGEVHLRLTKEATTLVVRHVGPLQDRAEVEAEGSAAPPTN